MKKKWFLLQLCALAGIVAGSVVWTEWRAHQIAERVVAERDSKEAQSLVLQLRSVYDEYGIEFRMPPRTTRHALEPLLAAIAEKIPKKSEPFLRGSDRAMVPAKPSDALDFRAWLLANDPDN